MYFLLKTCFNNKYKYSRLNGECLQIIKKTPKKQKTKNKHYLKDCVEHFFNLSHKVLYMTNNFF